jgi:protein SCO1/2
MTRIGGVAALATTLVLMAGRLPAEEAQAPSCHETAPAPAAAVSRAPYAVPDVTLVDETGHRVPLAALLSSREPVALNFIFTTCTTICPVMTATFAQMRRELGDEAGRVRLVSISIDPEQDRPEVLRRYAERYGAGAGWTFLTGDAADVERVLRAFGAYAGSKMNHRPLTLLKDPRQPDWVRIEGLASGGALAHEVKTRLLD